MWVPPQFSSSKAFKLMTGHAQVHAVFKWLWKTSCQCKHKVLFWLVLKDRLSTRNILKRKGMHLDDYNCVLCQQDTEETLMHLLFHCPFAKDCLKILSFEFSDTLPITQIIEAWGTFINTPFFWDIFILVCWSLWMAKDWCHFQKQELNYWRLQKRCHGWITPAAS